MLKVKVTDFDIITVKPKITAEVKQYVIVCEDAYGHIETFFIDVDKFNKDKFTELVKAKYAARYRMPPAEVEVEYVREPKPA